MTPAIGTVNDVIHVAHSQGLKGGWSESLIIAGEEMGKEVRFPDQDLDLH